MNRLTKFYIEWRHTAIGKAVRDFFYSVVFTSLLSGLIALYPFFNDLLGILLAEQVDFSHLDFTGAFYAFRVGFIVAFVKAASYWWKNYKDPIVPNTPDDKPF